MVAPVVTHWCGVTGKKGGALERAVWQHRCSSHCVRMTEASYNLGQLPPQVPAPGSLVPVFLSLSSHSGASFTSAHTPEGPLVWTPLILWTRPQLPTSVLSPQCPKHSAGFMASVCSQPSPSMFLRSLNCQALLGLEARHPGRSLSSGSGTLVIAPRSQRAL